MKKRTLFSLAFVLLVLLLAGSAVFYLRSARFQRQACAELIARIEQATGLRLDVGSLSLDVFRGTFSLQRFDLHSSADRGSRFGFRADEISGSFRMAALWRPKIDLGELDIVRPRMRIVQDPGGAPWHLAPIMRRSLDLAARHVSIRDGWVELSNRRIPLSLTLEDLNCAIQYRPDPQSYEVQLAYRNSLIEWAGRRIVHDLRSRVNLLPDGLDIAEFELHRGGSLFRGSGNLAGWDAPELQITTVGSVASDDLTLLTRDLREARGDVNVSADLRWSTREFHVEGRFEAEKGNYRQSSARNVRGQFEIRDGVLLLRDVNGRVGAGTFRIEGELQLHASAATMHHVSIRARDVALRDAAGVLELRALALENRVDAEATLQWRHGLDDLSGEGTVTLKAAPEPDPQSGARTDLAGTAEFGYRDRTWVVKRADLASADTEVTVRGLDPSRLQLRLVTARPAEMIRLTRNFSSRVESLLARSPELAALSGRCRLDGEVVMEAPDRFSYQGRIEVSRGNWRGFGIDSLAAYASWNGDEITLRTLQVRKGTQSVQGELRVGMPRGDLAPDLAFAGTLRRVSLDAARELGVGFPGDATGTVSGSGRFSYRQGEIQGEGDVEIENGSFRGETFDLLNISARIADQQLQIRESRVRRGSAAIAAQGSIRLDTGALDLQARLEEMPLPDLPPVKAGGLAVDGLIAATGEIHGTIDKPLAVGNVDLVALRFAGWNLGQGKASIDLRDGILTAGIDVQSELGGFQGEARLSTDSGYPGHARLEFRDWNVEKLIAGNVPPVLNDLSTALHGTLVVDGPFAEPARLRYSGEMDGARFKIHGYELRNDGMMRFRAERGEVIVEEARLVGEGSSLALEKDGVIPIDPGEELNLRLSGTLNVGFLDRMTPKVGVSGSVALDVRATGLLREPEVIGKAALEDLRLEYEDFPYPVSGLRGNLVFSRNSIKLEGVTGAMASGTIQVTGTVEHQNGALRTLGMHVQLNKSRLRYPKDFVSSIDAELDIRGGPDTQVLTGDVTVLRAEYLRDFSVLEQFLGRSSTPLGPQVTDPLLAGMRLNVAVRSNGGLYIDNELTRVQGSMSLTLLGTLAYPSVTGHVEVTEGSIFFRGNRFDIVHGAADFLDRNRINPVFDIRAEADVRSYRLRLDISGDLDHLRVNTTSDPPLSTVDIVSLLTTGTSEGTGPLGTGTTRTQTEMTGLSAASILSESLTGVIGKRVERIFGLQSFRVDPFLAGAENDPTARVTISERLSNDLVITFSRNLSTSQQQIVVVEYDVNRNLSIVATRDEDGTYGVDFRFRKRFR